MFYTYVTDFYTIHTLFNMDVIELWNIFSKDENGEVATEKIESV